MTRISSEWSHFLPKTEMARNFHLRNGAKEVSSSVVTVNFEYPIDTAEDQ